MSNEMYDTLKFIALLITPILAFLASVVNIWNFPHGEQIVIISFIKMGEYNGR